MSDAPQAAGMPGRDADHPAAPGDQGSDEALMARLARRDPEALTGLYDRHRSVAYGIALRISGSVPAAEDILQEAFLDAWRHAGAFDVTRGSARAWLLSIVHHRSIDHVRRRRATDQLPEPEATPPASLVAPDVWPEVAGRLDAAAIRDALAELPAVQRETIELAYWGGLTQSEIAARNGVPLGTVKSRVRHGLIALGLALTDRAGHGGVGPLRDGPGVRTRPRLEQGGRADDEGIAQIGSACSASGRIRMALARFWRSRRRARPEIRTASLQVQAR
jgi:RNA polymerase sigma-70 factor (ECF subfamily)